MINILIFILIFNLQFSTFNLQFNKEIPAAITVSGFPVPPRC